MTQRERFEEKFMTITPPSCPYCEQPSRKATGLDIYPHRPDLSGLSFYLCSDCDAYVGSHRKTGQPLGRLANAELRGWRKKAHVAFDPLWKDDGRFTRKEAYARLATHMGITTDQCHIAMFDVEQCQQVIAFGQGELE